MLTSDELASTDAYISRSLAAKKYFVHVSLVGDTPLVLVVEEDMASERQVGGDEISSSNRYS